MREALAAVIVTEMLIQGVFFDSRRARRLPFNRMLITRVLRSLVESRVIEKSKPRRKYVLTNEFLNAIKGDVTRTMPRKLFIHCPDAAVFEVSGIDSWSEQEFELYVKDLRKLWLARAPAT